MERSGLRMCLQLEFGDFGTSGVVRVIGPQDRTDDTPASARHIFLWTVLSPLRVSWVLLSPAGGLGRIAVPQTIWPCSQPRPKPKHTGNTACSPLTVPLPVVACRVYWPARSSVQWPRQVRLFGRIARHSAVAGNSGPTPGPVAANM